MITQRRVFHAKPGKAAGVVQKMKEFQPIFDEHGGPKARIYTDHYSGHSDTVVWEFDVDGLSKLEEMEWAVAQDAEYQKAYETWYEGLIPLIKGATVELWNREV